MDGIDTQMGRENGKIPALNRTGEKSVVLKISKATTRSVSLLAREEDDFLPAQKTVGK